MSIKITRKSGWMGMASKIKIFLDEKEVGKIAQDETMTLELEKPESILGLKQFGMKSNKITVKDGDNLVIKPGKYSNILFILLIAFVFIIIAFLQNYIYALLAAVAYVLVSAMLDQFLIEKV